MAHGIKQKFSDFGDIVGVKYLLAVCEIYNNVVIENNNNFKTRIGLKTGCWVNYLERM